MMFTRILKAAHRWCLAHWQADALLAVVAVLAAVAGAAVLSHPTVPWGL